MHRIYGWSLKIAASPHALWFMAGVSFFRSSFFPIPPDVLLIPIVLAKPKRAFFVAAICTVASVAGGLLGYYIGFALYDLVAMPLLQFYGYSERFAGFSDLYNQYGVMIVLFGAMTPFPYNVISIASGMMGANLVVFVVFSLLGRGARFFLIALMLWLWGEKVDVWIRKNLAWLSIVFFVLVIGGFYLIRFL